MNTGTPFTITNRSGDSFKINDHTDPSRVIALQSYPASDVETKNDQINLVGQHLSLIHI